MVTLCAAVFEERQAYAIAREICFSFPANRQSGEESILQEQGIRE
jgi:hypothetical protein